MSEILTLRFCMVALTVKGTFWRHCWPMFILLSVSFLALVLWRSSVRILAEVLVILTEVLVAFLSYLRQVLGWYLFFPNPSEFRIHLPKSK
jgi:hypothetical protein